MDFREKKLYHQIHPAKLFIDWSTGIIAFYFLWLHKIIIALIVMFVPAFIASVVIIQFVNLEKYKRSPFGNYINGYMTNTMEGIRFIGFAVAAFGAWFHTFWLIPCGIIIIIFGWIRGILLPKR